MLNREEHCDIELGSDGNKQIREEELYVSCFLHPMARVMVQKRGPQATSSVRTHWTQQLWPFLTFEIHEPTTLSTKDR